jgi:hypothetical protein
MYGAEVLHVLNRFTQRPFSGYQCSGEVVDWMHFAHQRAAVNA